MTEHRNRETVQFLSNVPARVALQRPDGKIVSGVYGERMMYSLSDGRVMFLDLDVAAQINQLEVQPNEAFWICKQRLSGKGLRHIWKVWRGDDEPATLDGETALQRDLRHSINMARNGGQGVLVVPNNSKQRPTAQAQPKPQSPAPAPKGEPERQVDSPVALQPAQRHLGWVQFLISQTNALTDAYAASLQHANQYGTTVKPEDVRTLLVTAFINLGKTGAATIG